MKGSKIINRQFANWIVKNNAHWFCCRILQKLEKIPIFMLTRYINKIFQQLWWNEIFHSRLKWVLNMTNIHRKSISDFRLYTLFTSWLLKQKNSVGNYHYVASTPEGTQKHWGYQPNIVGDIIKILWLLQHTWGVLSRRKYLTCWVIDFQDFLTSFVADYINFISFKIFLQCLFINSQP